MQVSPKTREMTAGQNSAIVSAFVAQYLRLPLAPTRHISLCEYFGSLAGVLSLDVWVLEIIIVCWLEFSTV